MDVRTSCIICIVLLILVVIIIVDIYYFTIICLDSLFFFSPVSSFIWYWGCFCSAVVLTPLPSFLSGIEERPKSASGRGGED